MKIVQIGASWGDDDLSRVIKSQYLELELLILVEPNQLHLEKLAECYQSYPNTVIENIAVKPKSNDQEELTIYWYPGDSPQYAVASYDPGHIYKHYGMVELENFTVPCLTIEQLLDKHNLKKLDWLLIDVEGLDAELVLGFDWSSYDIKRVDIEHLHLGDRAGKVYDLLLSHGYHNIPSTNHFDWAFEK